MPSLNKKTFSELINKSGLHIEQKLPFVLYRKPKEQQVIGIFQSDGELNSVVDFKESGFVFAPFDSKEDAFLIRPDEVIVSSFQRNGEIGASNFNETSEGKEAHIKLVENGIKEIIKGNLQKVVLSRVIEVPYSKNPKEIFTSLLNNYPNAFCYLFYHPKVGMWCGATPETLLQVKEQQLKTMSLAATLPISNAEKPIWGSKEIEEQQMVSDYIQKRLANKMDSLEVGKAETIKAGKLWHLKSEITGHLSNKTDLREILEALHPTPAVCGIPVEAAKNFITKNENYKRTFYTGFLGELNLGTQTETSLYVNLRCMELKEKKAAIFVGGGITLASNPDREWVETQNKSRTMLNIL
ncbi:chorismate-binding protein [Flagellimonas sp. W118]|uniref:chorismate-binding protein n=1 Tax=Flagellimonas sp. W118 TaxID=3410791 RepID=UPI003BF4B3AE